MVQVAGAHQLRNPLQEKQGSKSDVQSSMWPVLVFGILTAIFAWLWFGGKGKKKELDTGVQPEGTEEDKSVGREHDTAPHKSVKSEPESLENSHSLLTTRITSGEGRLNASAPNDNELHSECVQEKEGLQTTKDEVHLAGILTDEFEQTKEKLVRPVHSHEKDGMQPKGEVYPGNVSEQEEVLTSVEDSPADVPGKDGFPSNIEATHSPEVPNKDGVQSNVEDMHPPNIPEKEGVQTNVEDSHTDIPVNNWVQSNVEDMHLPDAQEKQGVQIMEDELHLTDECVQTKENLVHSVYLHEETGMQSKGNVYLNNVPQEVAVQGNVVDSPTDVSETGWMLSNGEEPCHASGSAQEKVLPINFQKDGVVHINAEEDGQVHAQEEENPTGDLLVASTDKGNSVNILEAAKERKRKEECDVFDHKDVPLTDIYVSTDNHGNSVCEQPDFVRHESFQQLKSDLDLDKQSSANQNDFVEPTTCVQEHTYVSINGVSSETAYEGLTGTYILDDCTLQEKASPLLDKFTNMLPISKQEEGHDVRALVLDEKACFSKQSEAKFHDDYSKAKRVAAVQPMPQSVDFGFKVHYITHSDSQCIAVTGDHEKLGEWETSVPLTYVKDGFWSHSITLPADTSVEWKFVMVENGKIKRWEECNNRCLKTAHDDIETQQWWGYP
ncbi:starch-binding domain-containing protein 1 [Mixophyes fleayi]|uniref:starch-binding domain-containing protein 1 n=1 Tax=Mixophyes fleayi TaxID=3061075 RepID=UPI003F4DA8B9